MKTDSVYVATFHGDISELPPIVGNTLDECLRKVREIHGYGMRISELRLEQRTGWRTSDPDFQDDILTPDPEDDKIEVWEFNVAGNTAKVVWGFWGWHWTMPDDLEQGKMPEDNKSLYDISMMDY